MNEEVKQCEYCGCPVEKPKTWSKATWEGKAVYCCRDHSDLARRANCMSYLGRFLLDNEVKVVDFHRAVKKYADVSLNFIIQVVNRDLSRKGYSFEVKDMAIRLSLAVHDLVPDLCWGPGIQFDYRMILKRGGSLYWPEGVEDRKGILTALRHSGIRKADFEQLCRDPLPVISSDVAALKVSLVELFDRVMDGEADLLYREKKWERMLRVVMSRHRMNDARVCFLISRILKGIGAQELDYRRLLDPWRVSDYWGNVRDSYKL